jgi:hypothetical protein
MPGIQTPKIIASQHRKVAFELLRVSQPMRVVVDSDLPVGGWYIVRGRTPKEIASIKAQEGSCRN